MKIKNFKNTKEFKIDNYGIQTNIATPLEYFATAFECYISYPDDLYCPMTYNYFNNLMLENESEYSDNSIFR